MSVRHRWTAVALTAVAFALASACSVDQVTFTGVDEVDDVDAAADAPPGVLALVVSATSVEVDELAETTFEVRLSQPPSAAVFVSVQGSDDAVLAVRPNLLVFEAGTWDDPQVVTVTGRQDLDAFADAGSVSLTTSTAGSATVVVTVNDLDALQIVTTPLGPLQVDEGATTQVAVKLSAMPAGDVVVEMSSLDPAIAAVAPGTLTFTTGDWMVAQDVLVTGVHDLEADDETTTIGFTSPGAPEVAARTLTVDVIDDERLQIVPSSTNLGTLAEGATTTFTVRLNALVTADLDVSLASSDPGALTVAPATLDSRRPRRACRRP